MDSYDSYLVYVQWCRDHNRTPPTKAWWDRAVAKQREIVSNHALAAQGYSPQVEYRLDQAEIDDERREG